LRVIGCDESATQEDGGDQEGRRKATHGTEGRVTGGQAGAG
jgi:hypothetical protein